MVFSFFSKKSKVMLASFAVPIFIMSVCYIFCGIAPFGDKSLMAMDAYGQYFPMLCEFRRNSDMWSFAGGLGFDMVAQGAYYTNSPLWMLLRLVPESCLISAVDLIVLVRFGLAGMTFCIMLIEKHRKISISAAAFSSAYSLSAYTIAFINQFMWMDAVVLLPIVIMGMDRLFRQKSPFLYIFSLAMTLYCNFYIGYMVCIFCVMYFIYLILKDRMSFGDRVRFGVRFCASSVTSGGIAACTLVPVYLALQKTIAAGISPQGLTDFYGTLFKLIMRLLPFQEIALAYELPNLYCGAVCILLVILYPFMMKNFRKTALVYIGIAFMLFSFNFGALDYFWHGFHYPNQLPGRQSFIFVFIAVSAAYEVFLKTGNIKLKKAAALLLVLEIGANCIYTVSTQTWLSDKNKYTLYDQYIGIKSDGFFRTEFAETVNHNGGQRYGFNGVTYYSSLMPEKMYRFFERAGMDVYAKNVSTCYRPSDILNAVLGVKYIIEVKDGEPYAEYRENEYCLPLFFAASEDVLSFKWENLNGQAFQQGLFNAVCGEKVTSKDSFEKVVKRLQKTACAEVLGDRISGTVQAEDGEVLFITLPCDSGWSVYIDGEKAEKLETAGFLTAVRLTEGRHTVKINYFTPGLKTGIILSVISFAACFMWFVILKRR